MKVKGIKRGQTIELLEEVDTIQDGEEVLVEISKHPLSQLSPEERLARINAVLGGWKDRPDLKEIFAEIDRERHAYRGRQIDSFND